MEIYFLVLFYWLENPLCDHCFVLFHLSFIVMYFHLFLQLDTGKTFQAKIRFDTDVELTYFHHGGILNYMIRTMSEN